MANKGKQKYDFEADRIDFFMSDIPEVKAYFEHKYGTYNRHIASKTTGWKDQKKDFYKNKLQQAEKDCGKELQDKWKDTYKRIEDSKITAINELLGRLEKQGIATFEIINILKFLILIKEDNRKDERVIINFGIPRSQFISCE